MLKSTLRDKRNKLKRKVIPVLYGSPRPASIVVESEQPLDQMSMDFTAQDIRRESQLVDTSQLLQPGGGYQAQEGQIYQGAQEEQRYHGAQDREGGGGLNTLRRSTASARSGARGQTRRTDVPKPEMAEVSQRELPPTSWLDDGDHPKALRSQTEPLDQPHEQRQGMTRGATNEASIGNFQREGYPAERRRGSEQGQRGRRNPEDLSSWKERFWPQGKPERHHMSRSRSAEPPFGDERSRPQQSRLQYLEDRYRALEESERKARADLKSANHNYKDEIEEILSSHEIERRDLVQKHNQELWKLQQESEKVAGQAKRDKQSFIEAHSRTLGAREIELQQAKNELKGAHQKSANALKSAEEGYRIKLQNAQATARGEKQALIDSHRKALDAKAADSQRSKDELKELKSKRRAETEALESRYRGEKQEMMATHQKTLAAKDSELQQSSKQVERIKFESNAALQNVEAKAESTRLAAEQSFKEHVRNLLEAHEGEVTDMKTKHQDEVMNMKRAHKSEVANMEADFDGTMSKMQSEMDQRLGAASAELKRVLGDHNRLLEQLREEHDAEISQLEHEMEEQEKVISMRYQATLTRIRRENEQLSDALLARDAAMGGLFQFQSPESADDEIKQKFIAIQDLINNLVNPLSKLQWRSNRTVWSDSLLSRMAASTQQNQRLLKDAILKDAVWSILYRSVFCSPFRVLGEEGEVFEVEWNRHCGADESSTDDLYKWPVPGPETERWRYLTIKECREALTQKVSQVDPRARLKMSFKSSWDALTDDIETTLSEVVETAACDSDAIGNLGRKASAMWLDFQMHRCRLMFTLEGSGPQSLEKKSEMALRGSLTLTLQPLLRRHGNVKGIELDKSKVICEGKALSLS